MKLVTIAEQLKTQCIMRAYINGIKWKNLYHTRGLWKKKTDKDANKKYINMNPVNKY